MYMLEEIGSERTQRQPTCRLSEYCIIELGFVMSTDIERLLMNNREEILRLAERRGAKNVRVFGSVARGQADADSDIDFLVDLEPGRSLFDLGGLWMDLHQLLGRDVDVVTEKALHWYIRDRVLAEARAL